MDQINFTPTTAEQYRAVRYGIHRNARGKDIAEANRLADADLAQWRAEREAAAAADAFFAAHPAFALDEVAERLLQEMRDADDRVASLVLAASAAGLHDCAADLRRASSGLIAACCALHTFRVDTDFARLRGAAVGRQVA